MKKIFFILCIILAFLGKPFCQDSNQQDDGKKPVRSPFEGGMVIDNQTVQIPTANTLELIIHHRFGSTENGLSDLYGIYGASNIRIGLNYSIRDDIMVGIGTTRNKKYQDLQWKWNIFRQTRSNSMPVSITYFGDIALDGRSEGVFGDNYHFGDRLSYFTQLIICRKFTEAISFQVSPSFIHYNKVDTLLEHDRFAVSFTGRVKFSPQSSFIVNGDFPLNLDFIKENRTFSFKPKPNLGMGIEVSTSTHVFQVFIASAAGIINQENLMYNRNEFGEEGILLGFNITRLWNF
jgi:hypothetical protein